MGPGPSVVGNLCRWFHCCKLHGRRLVTVAGDGVACSQSAYHCSSTWEIPQLGKDGWGTGVRWQWVLQSKSTNVGRIMRIVNVNEIGSTSRSTMHAKQGKYALWRIANNTLTCTHGADLSRRAQKSAPPKTSLPLLMRYNLLTNKAWWTLMYA